MLSNILVVTLTTVIAEVCARIYYNKIKSNPSNKDGVEAVEYILSEHSVSPHRKFIANPYTLYWNAPNRIKNSSMETNSQGYRSKFEISKKKNSNDFLILVLGGSTTFSDHFISDHKKTWTGQLEKFLRSYLPKHIRVRVVNAGLNYATTAELLSHYIYNGQHLLPDIVFLDGPGNDFLPVAFGDKTTDYRYTRKSISFQKRKFEKNLLRFYLIRFVYLKWVTSANLIQMEPEGFKLEQRSQHNSRLERSKAPVYKMNVSTLAKIVSANDSRLILVDFLRPSRQKMKTTNPKTYNGLLRFNQVCSQINDNLAKNFRSVFHINLAKAQLQDVHFHDSCHLTETGEFYKARFIFEYMKKNKLLNLVQ